MIMVCFASGMMDGDSFRNQSGVASRTARIRRLMAQNHYVTKSKRRNKSKKRKDPAQATMAKLRELKAAEAKRAGK